MPLNVSIVQGNLVRNVEMANTRDSDIANFTVANTRKYKQKETTIFLDCVAYGDVAININKFFGKGDPIIVQGRLTQNEWEDRKTGDKRSKVILTVETFSFAGETKDKQGGRGGDRGRRPDYQGNGQGGDRDRGGRDDSRDRDRDRDRDQDKDRDERGSDRSRGRDDDRGGRSDPRGDEIPF